ncbi:hypothetical protein Nepgr_017703 [Nepenthes gracilis]|uniref:Uncharacterized protein n=1 Tax=Nepenthes gracilis TaxID=150966 RepID=A0AAD3SRL2_NEPGR|nr:hypothetical protein Nepgr_017703 [Nepenthes gracilis]
MKQGEAVLIHGFAGLRFQFWEGICGAKMVAVRVRREGVVWSVGSGMFAGVIQIAGNSWGDRQKGRGEEVGH